MPKRARMEQPQGSMATQVGASTWGRGAGVADSDERGFVRVEQFADLRFRYLRGGWVA